MNAPLLPPSGGNLMTNESETTNPPAIGSVLTPPLDQLKLEKDNPLKTNGDYYEHTYYDYFSNLFPNYEKFWKQFIYPNRSSPQSTKLKELGKPFKRMCAYHYGAYQSLARAKIRLDKITDLETRLKNPKEGNKIDLCEEIKLNFEDAVVDLSQATDCTKNLILSIIVLDKQAEKEHNELFEFPTDDLIEPQKYDAQLIYRRERKGAESKDLIKLIQFIQLKSEINQAFKNFRTKENHILQKIASYRNKLVHDFPLQYRCLNALKLPKLDAIEKQKEWESDFKETELDEASTILSPALEASTSALNDLWNTHILSKKTKIEEYVKNNSGNRN